MKILRYIKAVFLAGPMIIYYHFRYILKFVKHPERYSFEYRFKIVQKEIRKVLNLLHVDYKIEGIEKFYNLKENALVISNHLSDIDPLLFIACSEKPITFISKKEAFKFPFVGKIATAIEVFPLDRQNLMAQVRQIKEIEIYLKNPEKPSVLVYIEGTRNKHPENPCLDFHPGTIKMAQKANAPVLTMATYGTFRALDKKSYLPKVPCFFSFLREYSKEEIAEKNSIEFANELKQIIDDEVDKLRKIDYDYINNLKISKKKKELEIRFDARVIS